MGQFEARGTSLVTPFIRRCISSWQFACWSLSPRLLWTLTLTARRGRPCWPSRLSISCGDQHFLQSVLAFAKFRRSFWQRCVFWLRDSFFMVGRSRGVSAHRADANGRLYVYSLS